VGRLGLDDGRMRSVRRLVEVTGNSSLDLEAAVARRVHRLALIELERTGSALAAFLDLAQARQQVALDVGEFVVSDLPISRCISAASNCSRSAVSSSRSASAAVRSVSSVQEMPEIIRESKKNISNPKPKSQNPGLTQCWPARSSLSRMLTKLYGGHGPVYLNVSLSNREAISLIRLSKAGS